MARTSRCPERFPGVHGRCAVLLVLVSVAARDAAAQRIAPFADLGGTSCAISAPQFVPTPVYILAMPGPFPGLIEARFRVSGLPAALYTTSVASNPAALVSGDPLGDGCNLYFDTCQAAPVHLYTITLTNQGDTIGDRILRVETHLAATQRTLQCPLQVVCDPPSFTIVCATGGTASLNGRDGCELAVDRTTWSRIKTLYD